MILRAVNTVDAMTAEVEELAWPVLHRVTDRILREVPGVNRVCYDLSPKTRRHNRVGINQKTKKPVISRLFRTSPPSFDRISTEV